MKYPKILAGIKASFRPETFEEVKKRYKGYGADFFPKLFVNYPNLKSNFKFFKDPYTKDIWSCCEIQGSEIGIQINSDYMVIWDTKNHVEVGNWEKNPTQAALELFKKEFL